MKNFVKNNKKAVIISLITTLTIILIVASIFIIRTVKINNCCSEINHIYSTFSETESISEKNNIFNEFVNNTEGNKYSKVENTYNETVSKMKSEISNKIEIKINNFASFDYENKTKEELTNEIKTLNSFLETIKNDMFNSISNKEVEKYENQINDLITIYNNKINEMIKIEENKKIEVKEEEKTVENKDSNENNNSTSNTSINNNNNNNNNSTENKNYIKHAWSTNPDTGEKIEGSDTFVDSQGNVYDINGNFLYNLSEWGITYYTYEK